MKGSKILTLGASLVVAFALTACEDPPTEVETQAATFKKTADNGNGLPTGWHATLHIHGADDQLPRSTPDESKQNMWVKLHGKTKIMLGIGDFYVWDANGLVDGETSFTLPNPDPNGDGATDWTVYAIGRGPGSADMTTCGVDDQGNLVCSTGTTLTIDNKGRDWDNVVRELFYLWDVVVCDDQNVCTLEDRVALFDDRLEGQYWDYDNDGLRLATLRFYNCETVVGTEYETLPNDSACFE